MVQVQAASFKEALSVASYLDQWLTHARARVRATTYRGYEGLIRLYAVPGIGEIKLGELHPLQIQGLYADLLAKPSRSGTLSAKTVGNLHRVLRQALGQAVRWRLLDTNPADAAQPPRASRPEIAAIDQDMVTQILAKATDTRWETPVAIAVATGMRRGEILGLRWTDLDAGWTVARVARSLQSTPLGTVFEPPKTPRSRRAVALPEFLRPYLERQWERQSGGSRGSKSQLIVCRADDSPWAPNNFSSAWPRFLRRAGLPLIRFHDLRHAHATLMLLQGVHPKIVSERLGHSSIGITLDTYSHVLPSMQEEAVRAFDELFAVS